MGSVLRRDARPPAQTERGRVTAVNDDGTVDVTVGARPYPYAGIRGHSGVGKLALGDMVEVGFVDRHLHGRKWLPFVLGHSGHYSGSGSTTGPMGGALSWHYSAGYPDGRKQKYRTDTPYTGWRLDTGWSLAGASTSSIIAYAVGGTGYILFSSAGTLTCYIAESGTVAWTQSTTSDVMIFNDSRSELILMTTGDGAVSVHNPVDGTFIAGPTTIADVATYHEYCAIYEDRIAVVTGSPGGGFEDAPRWPIYARAGNGTTSYSLAGYTDRCTMPRSGTYGWSGSTRMTADGKVPVRVGGRNQYGTSLPTTGLRTEEDSAIFLVDVETGDATMVEYVQSTAAGFEVGSEHSAISAHEIIAMGADGRYYGRSTETVDAVDSTSIVAWAASGARRASFEAGVGYDLGESVLAGRIVYKPATAGTLAIYSESGGLAWTPAYGFDGQEDDLWGGEDGMGGDPWVLLPGPTTTPAQPIDDTWQFRDPRNGNLLGAWAGGAPRMVAAGRIYDLGGSGELRRWVPA